MCQRELQEKMGVTLSLSKICGYYISLHSRYSIALQFFISYIKRDFQCISSLFTQEHVVCTFFAYMDWRLGSRKKLSREFKDRTNEGNIDSKKTSEYVILLHSVSVGALMKTLISAIHLLIITFSIVNFIS